jgi:hypothetical protein
VAGTAYPGHTADFFLSPIALRAMLEPKNPFQDTTLKVGIREQGSKKQRTWSEAPASRRFALSNPVSERRIREDAFENGYREPELGGIAWSLPNVLRLLDYRRLR